MLASDSEVMTSSSVRNRATLMLLMFVFATLLLISSATASKADTLRIEPG